MKNFLTEQTERHTNIMRNEKKSNLSGQDLRDISKTIFVTERAMEKLSDAIGRFIFGDVKDQDEILAMVHFISKQIDRALKKICRANDVPKDVEKFIMGTKIVDLKTAKNKTEMWFGDEDGKLFYEFLTIRNKLRQIPDSNGKDHIGMASLFPSEGGIRSSHSYNEFSRNGHLPKIKLFEN